MIEAEWSEVKKAIDFGAALGAKHYLCSVAYVPQLSYYKNITAAIKVLNQIVSYAKENGMKCGIVNCMMGGNYIRTPEQWKLVLDEVPGLGIKYDPSHSFVHGGDKGAYLKEGMEWGDKFVYCHVKGVIQYGDSHEPSEWKNRELMVRHPGAQGRADGATLRQTDVTTTTRRQASIPSTGAHSSRCCISTIMTATSQLNRTP